MKRLLLWIGLGLCLAPSALPQHIGTMAYQVAKQTNAPPGKLPPGDRFLFLVDTSLSMRKLDAANRQTIFDMIFTGLGGRMREGDTYGLWTFNEQTYAGLFPMQTWKKEETLQQASAAALFLKNQSYEHQAQLGIALVKLDAVIRVVRDLHILILSDGDPKMQGTPFDKVINDSYEQRSSARSKAKKPFVTTFVAQAGKVMRGDVTIAGEPLSLPERVEPVQIAKATETKPEPKPVEAPPQPKKIVITEVRQAVPPKPVAVEVAELTPAAPVPVALTNSPAVAETNASPSRSEDAPTVVKAPPAAVEPPKVGKTPPPATPVSVSPSVENQTPPPSPSPAPPPSPFTALLPAPLPVSARELSINAPAPLAAVGLPTEPLFSPRAMFLTGLGLLIASMGLIVFFARFVRPAPRPSFISQSMARETADRASEQARG